MALSSGSRLGPYEIAGPLGAGGMGEVYRAADTKLGRDVAIKVLPAEMASDPERLARFQREARVVAALNHPNIVTIHSVEEADGVHFLTMELVEGQALDRLIPEKGLPLERIVEIGSALAEALGSAHEKGIVHRDLKPQNVMVTPDGRVKVLDFGLAKDVRAETSGDAATLTSAGHTQAGIVMGTPAYMSPEQVSGRVLDHRTDIFSLGVLLHQMATGRRPFDGHSSAELTSAILRDTPPLVTELRDDLPPDLARIIRRCLEKDPRHRIQTARDIANEFRDLARQTSQKLPAATSAAISAVPVADSGAARAEEGFWVAVLPFRHKGSDPGLEAFAEGITEEIITGLSRFSYLRVIARGSTGRYSSESRDIPAIGKELGARYVMEGSIRQAGATARVAVQLVDASSGAHLWAETFERPFRAEEMFALQDALVPRIVSTVADQHGILPRSIRAEIRKKGDAQLSPYEAVFRVFGLHERMTQQEHGAVRDLLERAVREAPDAADCWAMLATLYSDEDWFGFNLRPDPLGRALAAAQRAVELAPASALASQALAQSLFMRREWQSFRPVAERTIALNPMDGATVALMGILLACTGEWERGCAVADSAMRLNPNFPGWYRLAAIFNSYRTRDYRTTIGAALRIQMPGYFWTSATCAAAYGQLGERDAAQKALTELLASRPSFATAAREELGKWFDPELREHFVEGLRKAGLETRVVQSAATGTTKTPEALQAAPALEPIALKGPSIATEGTSRGGNTIASPPEGAPARPSAGVKGRTIGLAIAAGLLVLSSVGIGFYLRASRTGGIDSIAVLPLENRSNDPEADYISDGITESINNGLARLPGLKVTPHSVAFHYKGKPVDVQKVGGELGVQAVLAGSVAQRGDNLTVEVELDDIRNGRQLWGEQYNRKLADLLAVESDIAVEVSQRLRAQLSAEDKQKLTKGSTENPQAYQLYLKGRYYTNKLTKDAFGRGIGYFNQAIALDPNYGLAYGGLAYNYVNQIDWFMPPNEAAPKAKDAATKALAIDDSDSDAHLSLAIVAHWYEWDWVAAEREFKRAIELNPKNSEAHGFYSWALAMTGRKDEALAEAKRSQEADPLSSLANGFVGTVLVFTGQWDPAIEQLRSAIELDPSFWFNYVFLGRAYEQKGRLPEAIAEFQRALELEKDNAEIWSGLGHAYAVSGKKVKAQKVLAHLKELSVQGYVAPYNVAIVYAGLGEKDQVFAWLERAYSQRSYYMAAYLTTDSRLDGVRSDPRFADLVRRIGLPSAK